MASQLRTIARWIERNPEPRKRALISIAKSNEDRMVELYRPALDLCTKEK